MKFNYNILEKTDNNSSVSLKLSLYLDDKMAVFDGHFRKFPILPAVAQLYFVEKIAQQTIKNLGAFSGMSQVKFMAPILPKHTAVLLLEYDCDKKLLKFSYQLDTAIKSKGVLKYI